MKKRFTILTAAIALLAVLAIPMGMKGQTRTETTTTYTFSSKSWAASPANWTSGKDGNQFQNGRGVQVTTGVSGANATSPISFENVSKVVVTYSTNASAGAGSIAVQVGTNSAVSQSVTKTGGTTDRTLEFNFDPYQTGSVKFTITCTTNSIYVKSIAITTTSGSSNTPTLSVNPSSINFGDVAINPSSAYEETFEVSFANLTEDLSVTGFTGVTVSPTTISKTATSPATVTVSYNPTAEGTLSGNITVSNTADNLSETVSVTGSAYDPSNADTYQLFTGALVEGDYVIYNTSGAMKNELNGGPRFNNESVIISEDIITNPSNNVIWHIAPVENTNYWTIYNAAINKYAGGTSSKNQGALLSEVTDHAKWIITYQYSNWTIENYGRSQDNSDPSNKYLRQNTTNGWATYGSGTGVVPKLYKKVVTNQVAMPTFSPAAGTYYAAQSVELSCATSGATIYYTTDGSTPTTSSTAYTTAISVSSTTTIKAIAVATGMTNSDVATATYTIESPYNNIPALFAAATATEQNVLVTFNNWVVSGVSTNGKNVYVTDNSGNGFIIYFTSDMSSTFAAGKILSGTAVSCKLKLYNGAAELINLDANDLTITLGGTVSTSNIAMADLAGVNTGALVHYDNLTCSITDGKYYLSDGTTTLQAYNTLYAFNEFEDGKTYNVTGLYVQYNSTKEIAPRSTSDIEEVVVTPVAGDKYVKVTSTTDLTSGQYLVVYEDGSVAFNGGLETLDAVNNTIGVSIINNEIAVNTTTAASEFTIDVTAGTIKSASGYYIGRTSNSNGMNFSQSEAYTNTISFDENYNAVITSSAEPTLRFNDASNQNRFRYYASGQKAIQLYKKVEPVTETFTLNIDGWDPDVYNNPHDYYLIASPLAGEISPADVTNMTTSGTFQLYSFDPTNLTEWQSYASHNDMKLKPGQGYLYTHKTSVELTFTGTAYNGEGKVTLVQYDGNETQGSWNLVGNSLSTAANIFDEEGHNKTYYRMKSDGSELIIGEDQNNFPLPVAPMEGVFVYAEENGEVITFSTASAKANQQLAFNITQGRSEAIDRAIVRFDEGQELPKFQIDPSHTKLYIPQSEEDYAVVRAATDGVMPLNFKAESDGNYTISINVENVELNTLVLIDNLTGNEVNLLSRAEYSFDATTEDDENRFTLVYSKSGETKTYKLTITADDFNTTSYAANNTEKTSNAVNVDDPTDTYEVVWASNQVMKNTSGQMQWQKGNGRIYNITNMGSITDVTVDGISGGFTTYYGESIEPAWSGITGQPFFQTKTYDDAVGYSTSLEVTFDIEEGTATTYSVTFDAGEGTFVGNEDFPNTENTKAAGIYTLPDATREGYVFNGWLATGTTTPRTGSYTVYTDVEFTAQYTENGASGGNGGTDVLDLEFTGVSGTNYTSWSDKEGESGAVYAGNSAGGNSAIQLRSSNNNSGIITTASGGMISKVVVTWNENTINGRVLNVYGKNTAYTAVTDLYNTSKQGTLLGTITCGTSTELLVSDEYTFIGLRSNSGAMYIDEISITWVLPSNVATPTFSPAAGTYMGTQTVTISCETDGAVIYYTTDGSTPDNTSEVYDGGITVSQTTTIQAIAYVGTEASHVASATYTIVVPQTIAEVREQGTGTVLTSGIVTAVSTNSNGTTAYMQDMTAAIVVYGDFTAEVGDEIQVSGTLTTFRGLLEIGTPTVTVLSQENEVDPTVMTIAEIIEDAEGDNEYQAMLVSIVEATVTEINGNNTIIAQDENTITVYGSLGDVEEDDVISFTGNIGCYNTVQIVNPTDIEIQGSTTMPTFITEGDWNVAENWSTGVVPNNDDDVVLNANVTITGIAEANSINQGSYTITIEDGGQLRFNEDYIRATVKKFVPGYGAGNENARAGYKLLTNPINVYETSQIEGLLTGNYDVYYWDETADGEEWRNIEDGDNYFYWPDIYGYLYANEEDVTLSFTGTVYANFVYNQYEVTYHEGHAFSGLNLIGNTFVCETYLTNEDETEVLPYYRMNETGDRLVAVNTATPIAPMEAIFYHQANEWAWVNFNRTAPTSDKGANLNMVVSEGRGTVDNAIVSFNNHNTLEKFSFSESGSKLYIPQNGKDYAVVYSEGIGEMPVNFKAVQNGTYTLSFSNDNVEFSYLHLIDNMTGAEVDLLANPSYSFEAKSSDYASRFKLVFVVNEDNLNNNDNFAFVSNGNIVINGEGTLQVIDMTGRIVSVEEVNGMSSVNVNAAGVYVLQLTNGESVKTQKIVVK